MLAQFWGLRNVGFTPADVAAANTVAARLRDGTEVPDVILACGDRALGLGQVSRSSVDLVVIGDPPDTTERVFDVDGTRVEVTVIPPYEAEELLALATDYRATTRWSPQLAIGSDRLRDLIRLVTGHRLVTQPPWHGRFDAVDVNTVRQTVISRAAVGFAASAGDAFAALLSGDLFTSVSASVNALQCGCQAVLAAAGDLDTDARFVFRRLARTPVTVSWCGRLWQLCNSAFPADVVPEPTTVRAIVEERLLVGNLLLSWCAVEGWATPLASLAEPATLLGLPGGDGPRRSAYFVPVRFADGWALLGPRQTYQTTEAVVRLWRRLIGRQPDDAVHDLAGAEPELADLPIADIEAAVTALHRIGAVEAPISLGEQAWPGASGRAPIASPTLSITPTSRFR